MQLPPNKPARTLEDYGTIAWRRRWWLIVPLFLGWCFVVISGRFMAPRYRSETVILIEQQRASEQYVLPNLSIDLQARLQNITQQILSRTKLLEITRRFHLYGQDQIPNDPEALVERMRRDIKIDLIQALGRPGELSAFRVSYSAPSPVLAQQITKELTSFFIDENLRTRRQTSENTTQFLEKELDAARADLEQQDERLRTFKASHLGELPEQLQTNVQVLTGLQTRLQAQTDALEAANQQQLYLESLLVQYQGSHPQQSSGAELSPANVDDQLAALNAQLADLSVRYKPDHPDVHQLKEKIARLEQWKREGEATADSAASAKRLPDPHEPAPVLQVKNQLSANKLQTARLQQTVSRLEKQIGEYQNRLNIAPLREQEFAEINRDHQQSRTAYESLLNKKTQSEMATDLVKQGQGEVFSVIDPPNLPEKPYWPDRFKLSLLGLIFGMILALGATVLVEMLDVRIHREEDVRSLLAVPVLAGIPILQTPLEQRKQQLRRRAEAIAASALAALIPAITLFTYYRG
jgi:polysaccharide biosynthesis transport protein